ncbi:MAG: ATP-dependent DNA helicase RecG [Planctomycetota bacterium]
MKDDPDSSVLQQPVRYVKGVGPKKAELLAGLGIHTVEDLLNYLPRTYLDTGELTPISQVKPGAFFKVLGTVAGVSSRRMRRSGSSVRHIVTIDVRDDTGKISAVWFNAPYLGNAAGRGDTVTLSGKTNFYKGLQMVSPALEVIGEGRPDKYSEWSLPVLPAYKLTAGLSQRIMRMILSNALSLTKGRVKDCFDRAYLAARKLLTLERAYRAIHRPATVEEARSGRKRLAYDELFLVQMIMALRRRALKVESKTFRPKITPAIDEHIRKRFPFVLTPAQEKVIREITADIENPAPMNRLLQGDVGSGKTVVALYAMLGYVANGFQTAIMAPTEILAGQHYNTVMRYLKGSRVRTALLVGRQKKSQRAETIGDIAAGNVDVIIGTHALIQKDVGFAKLGIIVVDEQHKFGVLQRGELRRKGLNPDVLIMTATPIPRTMAMTVFGDLDVSIIDSMPPGRIPPKTYRVPRRKLNDSYAFIRKEITAGRQAYFVYPLIEESKSEGMERLKAATQTYEHLSREIFPDLNVALLHGGMKGRQKEEIMRDFRDGETHILVATVVIEVGIDVPEATIMVIENAERFGLSQLHQLRGRIGRGGEQSYCLLFGDSKGEVARRRLDIMCRTSDGFRIAEEDLRLRGPGELFGTRQHGLPELRHADLIEDYALLNRARADAFDVVNRREFEVGRGRMRISETQFRALLEMMRTRFADRIELGGIA